MATIVKGTQVASHLTQRLQGEIEELKSKGISPCAAIVRVGENPSDMAYERGAVKKLESLGIRAVLTALPGDIRRGYQLCRHLYAFQITGFLRRVHVGDWRTIAISFHSAQSRRNRKKPNADRRKSLPEMEIRHGIS